MTINELTSKLKVLTEEHQQGKEEITKLRKSNTSLENDIHQYEKTVNHLRTKIALVEQELKSKQEIIQQSNDRIAAEQESKVRTTRKFSFLLIFVRVDFSRENAKKRFS